MAKFKWGKLAKEQLDQRHKTQIERDEADQARQPREPDPLITMFSRIAQSTSNLPSNASQQQKARNASSNASQKALGLVKCPFCKARVKPNKLAKHRSKVHNKQTVKPQKKKAQTALKSKPATMPTVVELTPLSLAKELAKDLPNAIFKLAKSLGADISKPTECISNEMGAALLERRRIPEKSGTLPNLPIAERGLRGRYELQTISYY